MSRLLLLAAPLASGGAVMALELVGLRLLAPHFGASTYVWGGLLGAIMAALAVGYLLGGALADRRPRPDLVFGLLLGGAAWVVGDLLLLEAVLDLAERQGATLGPIVATSVLLGPAMLLLGAVGPFVVRLEGRLPSLGVTAGRVFALSTLGSLAGTFATAFWLIPDFGCRATLRALVSLLAVLVLAGLSQSRLGRRRAAAVLALAAVPWLLPDPPPRPGLLFSVESPYSTVFVEKDKSGNVMLKLNDPRRGFHSVRLGGGLLTGAYYDVLYLGPLLARGSRVLILGMGGGTTARAYRQLYPGAHVTAVEIDPVVVRVAREYMGLEDGPDLEVHVDDARPFLARGDSTWDVVEIDVFAGGPYAPFYCLTREFFEAARERLSPHGLVSLNVYAPGGDRSLTLAVATTMGAVFPTVLEFPLAEESVLIGFRQPTSADDLAPLLTRPDLPPELRGVAAEARQVLAPAPTGGRVLVDDLAPVEQITHAMIERRRRRPRG